MYELLPKFKSKYLLNFHIDKLNEICKSWNCVSPNILLSNNFLHFFFGNNKEKMQKIVVKFGIVMRKLTYETFDIEKINIHQFIVNIMTIHGDPKKYTSMICNREYILCIESFEERVKTLLKNRNIEFKNPAVFLDGELVYNYLEF